MALALAAAVLVAGVAEAQPARGGGALWPGSEGWRGAAHPERRGSPECKVPASVLYVLSPLPHAAASVRRDKTLNILVLGSSMGGGAFERYPARLQAELHAAFKDIDLDVSHRILSGEVGSGVAELVEAATAEIQPDLVVLQIGTNDALARVDPAEVESALEQTLAWLKLHEIDAVLVEPQYAAALRGDERYAALVRAIGTIARRNGIPLVRRSAATEYLESEKRAEGGGQFALSMLAKRCLAEHVAEVIVLGIGLADGSPAAQK